jgi:hypothetical protein
VQNLTLRAYFKVELPLDSAAGLLGLCLNQDCLDPVVECFQLEGLFRLTLQLVHMDLCLLVVVTLD